jgi:hypothetical protein
MAALMVVALAVVIATGGLVASNMGFKLNYPLLDGGDAGSASGTQTIGLPYNRQVGIDLASDLFKDIGLSTGPCSSYACNCLSTISRYDTGIDLFVTYACKGADFALTPGEGLQLGMVTGGGGDYIVVGSHNPGLTINLACPGAPCGSNSGTEYYTHPYHAVSASAAELMTELGGFNFVSTISRYDTGTDLLVTYAAHGTSFPLVAGQAYQITTKNLTVPNGIDFTPAHY